MSRGFEDVSFEVACFEDEGRGQEPRNADRHQELEKTRK